MMEKKFKLDPDYVPEKTARLLRALNKKVPGVEYFEMPKFRFNILTDKLPKKAQKVDYE